MWGWGFLNWLFVVCNITLFRLVYGSLIDIRTNIIAGTIVCCEYIHSALVIGISSGYFADQYSKWKITVKELAVKNSIC